jgi:hypothetical protein
VDDNTVLRVLAYIRLAFFNALMLFVMFGNSCFQHA